MLPVLFGGTGSVGFWRGGTLAAGRTQPTPTLGTGAAHHEARMATTARQHGSPLTFVVR